MKKILSIFIVIIVLLSLTSCINLSPTFEEKIEKEYAEKYNRDIETVNYSRIIKQYDEVYVLEFIVEGWIDSEWYSIEEYHFDYYGGLSYSVYKNGDFWSLTKAYEENVISIEQVAEIHDLITLTEERENQIKTVCATKYNVTIEEVDIYVFYGVFDNVCLVRVGIEGFLYDCMEKTVEIGGVEFFFPGIPGTIGIVYQNNVYNLKEAYDAGIINAKHLKEFPKTFY